MTPTTRTQTIAKAFSQSIETYHNAAIAQRQIAQKLFSLIPHNLSPQKALEIGCGSGFLSRLLWQKHKCCQWFLNDLVLHPQLCALAEKETGLLTFLKGNAETLSFPASLDFIVSSSTLQWFQDLPAFLHKCAESLNPAGQIAFSTFGSDNLKEIRSLTQRGLTYASFEQWQQLLHKEFTDLQLSEEKIVLHFPSALDILRHLKHTGVNAGSRLYKSPLQLQTFLKTYEERYQTEQGITLTYHPIYIIAKRN